MAMNKKELEELLSGNKYVKKITNDNCIMYTDEFYRQLRLRLDSGMTALEAYASFGFDIEKLGENRAYAACKRAKKMDFSKVEKKYMDGTKHSSLMKDLSPEEELAYLRSRVFVLEQLENLKKKDPELYQWASYHFMKKE